MSINCPAHNFLFHFIHFLFLCSFCLRLTKSNRKLKNVSFEWFSLLLSVVVLSSSFSLRRCYCCGKGNKHRRLFIHSITIQLLFRCVRVHAHTHLEKRNEFIELNYRKMNQKGEVWTIKLNMTWHLFVYCLRVYVYVYIFGEQQNFPKTKNKISMLFGCVTFASVRSSLALALQWNASMKFTLCATKLFACRAANRLIYYFC